MSDYRKLSAQDGSWEALKAEWHGQCSSYGEDFDSYAQGTFSVLTPLAENSEPDAGVYAYLDGGKHAAIFQANCTPLPGYTGPVLRVRFMTLAPQYDFGDFGVDQYSDVLAGVFATSMALSDIDMKSQHLKFHLQSPADRQFFAMLEGPLGRTGIFESVQIRGAWLYITKK
ncbi:hypothetical protein ACD578_25635 [Microvirga sp. RSM25]|uniref:hypothetical protein n=1 Tax=Microvirga sp. RSM25 TaxID=3273802 RepID=UPI00384E2B65